MLCLSLETSTRTCSVALVEDNQALGEFTINSDLTHSQKLLPAVDMLLKSVGKSLDHVDLIGVSVGPGSFTGLRIGIATAKGLAYGRKKPIVGISTLEALAYLNYSHGHFIVPILNARRNQVYTGIFKPMKSSTEAVLTDCVIKLDQLIDKLNYLEGEFIFTGDGVPIFKGKITTALGNRAHFNPDISTIPRAVSVGYLAITKYNKQGEDNIYNIKPEYLRLSEAERNLLKGCTHGG